MHQFRFAQFANKALSNTYFAILALLELCKIICFPSLCSGTKYISTARSARCANKVSFRFNFYGLANFVYMLPFTTRWIKKYILLLSGWVSYSRKEIERAEIVIYFHFSDQNFFRQVDHSGILEEFQNHLYFSEFQLEFHMTQSNI